MRRPCCLAVLALWCVAAPSFLPKTAAAQSNGPATSTGSSPIMGRHAVAVPSATAARRTSPIALDGRLDDAAWSTATPVTQFTQVDPDEGQPATERTEMRFLFDDGALYVGARMFDSQGRAGVRTSLVRRDAQFNSDFIEIVIDGFHDHLGPGGRRALVRMGIGKTEDPGILQKERSLLREEE